MKLVILIFSFGLFSLSFAQEKNCDAIKTGTFYAKDKKKSTPILKIERTDSTQTETVIANNETMNYKVNWLNNCQFVLNPIQAKTDTNKIYRTVVTILKVKKYFYKFKATMLYQPVIYGKIYRKEEY